VIDLTEAPDVLVRYGTITFRRRMDAPNLIYLAESSADLANWSSATQFVSSTPGPGPNMETVTYRSLAPISGPNAVARVFLRVRVSLDAGNAMP
jgi:hypothetical protein